MSNFKKIIVTLIAGSSMLLAGCEFTNPYGFSVKIDKESVDIYKNEGVQLTASVSTTVSVKYDNTIVWSVADPTVASVENGYVYGINIGSTTVYAKLKVDNTYFASTKINVLDPSVYRPIEVTMDKTNANVEQGNSLQLTASVKYYSSDNSVTWATNSESVKVSDTGLVTVSETAVAGSTAVISAISNEDSSKYATCAISILEKPITKYDYTIMLYMCASSLEHDDSSSSSSGGYGEYGGPGGGSSSSKVALFTEDIQEILSVKNLPNSVKIIIETGGTKKWYFPSTKLDGATEISASKLQRWEVSNGKLKLIQTLNTNQMAKTESFQSFLEWGLKDYSADQMGVIVSGHGGGIAGCAYDDNYTYLYGTGRDQEEYSHCLDNSEIGTAAKNALANCGRDKFTWIGYDCCLMQTADTATINADSFNYMIASQESENGSGWNHDQYLDALVSNPKCTPDVFLPRICSAFLNDNHSSSERESCLQTLSVIDLSKISSLVTSFNDYVNKIGITSSTYSKCKTAFSSSYNAFGEKVYGLADFKSFMTKMKSQFSSIDTTAVNNALNDIVMANSYCSKYTTKPCGVNIFFPESLDREYYLQVGKEDYTGELATKFTPWQTLLLNNGSFGW